jgi:hypothetical protein
MVEGRRVAVVGAGASALDLCMHSIAAGAAGKVEWVVRTPRHFQGCALMRTLWPMVLTQLMEGPVANPLINLFLNVVMFLAHLCAGTLSWLPRAWFDVRYAQAVPGRGALLAAKDRLSRHVGAGVARVEAGAVHLTDGTAIRSVDLLLLGTGYDAPARPAGFDRPANFAGFLPTGDARGRLYLVGEDLLDTTAASPMVAVLNLDAFQAVTRGDAPGCCGAAAAERALGERRRWPAEGSGRLLNLLEPLIAAVPLARGAYPFYVWRLQMIAVYTYYRAVHRTTVFSTKRVIRVGMDLDKMPRVASAGGHGKGRRHGKGLQGQGGSQDGAQVEIMVAA